MNKIQKSFTHAVVSKTYSSEFQRDLCSWQHFSTSLDILGLILDRENWSNIHSVSIFRLDFNQSWKTNLTLTQNRRQKVFSRGIYVCAGRPNVLKIYKNSYLEQNEDTINSVTNSPHSYLKKGWMQQRCIYKKNGLTIWSTPNTTTLSNCE